MSGEEPVRVGVAVLAFDSERWLAAALESILAQSRPADDVLVLDNGSGDRTVAIAQSFAPAVRVVRDEVNAGIGAGRNRVLELVRGEVVAFHDADDLMTPASLAVRLEALERHPEVDIVWGHGRRFEEVREGAPVALEALVPSHTCGSMLARRSALERVGPFMVGVRLADGIDWLLRAREQGVGELTVAEQVMWRRVHGENATLRYRESFGEYARALKASLDRRRAAVGES